MPAEGIPMKEGIPLGQSVTRNTKPIGRMKKERETRNQKPGTRNQFNRTELYQAGKRPKKELKNNINKYQNGRSSDKRND